MSLPEHVKVKDDGSYVCKDCDIEVDSEGDADYCCGYASPNCDTCGHTTCDQSC